MGGNQPEVQMTMEDYHKILSKGFDAVKFTNGYQKNSPWFLIECKGVDVGTAVPEWSDNWPGDVFRIKLGNIIEGNCLPTKE